MRTRTKTELSASLLPESWEAPLRNAGTRPNDVFRSDWLAREPSPLGSPARGTQRGPLDQWLSCDFSAKWELGTTILTQIWSEGLPTCLSQVHGLTPLALGHVLKSLGLEALPRAGTEKEELFLDTLAVTEGARRNFQKMSAELGGPRPSLWEAADTLREMLRAHLGDFTDDTQRSIAVELILNAVEAPEGVDEATYHREVLDKLETGEQTLQGIADDLKRDLGDPAIKEEFLAFGQLHADAERCWKAEEVAKETQFQTLQHGLFRLPTDTYIGLRSAMQKCYPNEGLGYLLSDGIGVWFVPLENVSDNPRSRVRPSTGDLQRLLQIQGAFGLRLLGWVHSHPDAVGVFSDRDLQAATWGVEQFPEYRTLIATVKQSGNGFGLSSFSSDITGQVRGEDKIELY